MKKLFPLLLCSLIAFSACDLKDTYTRTNAQELVTVKGDYLVNDYGYVYTVTQDAVGRTKWQEEGARYLALFDILNRDLEINLKQVLRSQEASIWAYDEEEDYPDDPVEPFLASFSGGYLNLGFEISKKTNSDNAHPIYFYKEIDGAHMYLHVIQYGDGEDLRNCSKDELTYEERLYHIPAEEFSNNNIITLVWHYLDTDATGAYVLKERRYDIR